MKENLIENFKIVFLLTELSEIHPKIQLIYFFALKHKVQT